MGQSAELFLCFTTCGAFPELTTLRHAANIFPQLSEDRPSELVQYKY